MSRSSLFLLVGCSGLAALFCLSAELAAIEPRQSQAGQAGAQDPLQDRLRERVQEARERTVERDVVYVTRGEEKMTLDVYRPKGEGPHAGVIVIHGGAWRSGSKSQLAAYAHDLASRGHVAFAVSYRLAPQHVFPAQIDDCQEAVRWIVQNAAQYNVDPKRLGGIGYSAGGHLVAMLGAAGVAYKHEVDGKEVEEIIRLKAVAPGGAPCEFRVIPENSPGLAFWLGGTRKEKPDNYRNASPVTLVSKDSCPMFFFQGDEDELVAMSSPRAMMKALSDSGVKNEIFVIEGAGHVAAAMNRQALEKAINFLDEHLKPEVASASQKADMGK